MKTGAPDQRFLWGVATSAYQSEGGYNGEGEPQTNWARAETLGDVARTGEAARFWHEYAADFARCRELGLNAFRMGIEWSRVQPSFDRPAVPSSIFEREPENAPLENGNQPAFDYEAMDHYAAMLASCRDHGLEPVVTLHHFVHPAWLGSDPWLEETTPELFAAYVRKAVEHINGKLARPLHWFITINEPNMLVLNSYLGHQFPARARGGFRTMTKAYNQLLRAHVLAYNVLHDLYEERGWGGPQVTINNYCSDLYWSDKMLLDLLCVRERGIEPDNVSEHISQKARDFERAFQRARLPLHRDLAYYFGALIKRIGHWIGFSHFNAADFAPLLKEIYAAPRAMSLDYIGLDYYDPFAAHAFRLPVFWDHEFRHSSLRTWMLATVTSKWWDWRVLPRGLHFFCKHYAEDFGRPVLIAENGMALRRRAAGDTHRHRRDRMTRSQFLRLHVHEVVKIVNEGVPLIGYLHWSLFDNYEWGTYTPRFGLYSIDFAKSLERLTEDQFGDCPSETYAALVSEAREKLNLLASNLRVLVD